MEGRERVYVHECCVIPYRLTEVGVEFCLVNPVPANRWEFPKISFEGEDSHRDALLTSVAATAGLHGQLHGNEPLGHFVASRGDEVHSMTAYLMHVTVADDAWPQQSSGRRLWCLAEEVRVRLRRKPLRRFIDIALRMIDVKSRTLSSVNGHAAARQRAQAHCGQALPLASRQCRTESTLT